MKNGFMAVDLLNDPDPVFFIVPDRKSRKKYSEYVIVYYIFQNLFFPSFNFLKLNSIYIGSRSPRIRIRDYGSGPG